MLHNKRKIYLLGEDAAVWVLERKPENFEDNFFTTDPSVCSVFTGSAGGGSGIVCVDIGDDFCCGGVSVGGVSVFFFSGIGLFISETNLTN